MSSVSASRRRGGSGGQLNDEGWVASGSMTPEDATARRLHGVLRSRRPSGCLDGEMPKPQGAGGVGDTSGQGPQALSPD